MLKYETKKCTYKNNIHPCSNSFSSFIILFSAPQAIYSGIHKWRDKAFEMYKWCLYLNISLRSRRQFKCLLCLEEIINYLWFIFLLLWLDSLRGVIFLSIHNRCLFIVICFRTISSADAWLVIDVIFIPAGSQEPFFTLRFDGIWSTHQSKFKYNMR